MGGRHGGWLIQYRGFFGSQFLAETNGITDGAGHGRCLFRQADVVPRGASV
ncbi:hypothetical protein RRSWK_02123 [Rhodopirellula sp. SWK7]|nr:hypothetical protein RRSWK_02123 [Rhodopirellula sp. SWK7]